MRRYLRILMLFMILLSLSSTCYSMGLRSRDMKVELDYKPGLKWSQRYQIRTTSEHTQDYAVYIKGSLAEYITLEPDHFEDIAPGENPFFTVFLELPEDIEEKVEPGTQTIRVGIHETVTSSGGAVGVRTGSEALILIRFLYPGKHLKANLDAKDAELNKPAEFSIGIYNGGKQKISSVKAKIDVYDAADNKVGTTYTEQKPLESNTHDTLSAQLSTIGLDSGEYRAVATVYYDGEETQTEDDFKIGTLEVDILGFTKEAPAGKISPFDIEVQSRWNSNINDVYAEVKVGKQEFSTPTTVLEPWQKKELTGYLDATGLDMGEHDVKVTLYYDGKTSEKEGTITITEPEDTPIVPQLGPSNTTMVLLVSIIALLFLFNMIYLFKSRKDKRRQEELEMLIKLQQKKRKKR